MKNKVPKLQDASTDQARSLIDSTVR